jgi:hypothetical protein
MELDTMEYPDLFVFPEGHPPSPYSNPVSLFKSGKWASLSLPRDLRLIAVGWLERPGFATGPVPNDCIEALAAAHAIRIISDGSRGIHVCTLCGEATPQMQWRDQSIQLMGHGHYLVRAEKSVYMAPELLLHYIGKHDYCPPQEFVRATIHGEFLEQDDLETVWENDSD